jgi:flagellar biosynthetic protein FliO
MPQGRTAQSIDLRRLSIRALMLCAFMAAMLASAPVDSSIGNFDISKVRSELSVQGGGSNNTVAAAASAPVAGRRTVSAALLTLRMIGWLLLLFAILFVGAWVVKKIGLAGKSKISGGSMDIVEVLSLGQGKNILLVRVLDKVYVLGQTNQQITLLSTFEGQQALSLIAQKGEIVSLSQFKDVFHSFMEKFKKS